MTIGDRINTQRKKLGLTADDLAEKLGISRATMYRYENGDIEKLPITVIEPLAKALNTTPAYLMGWTEFDEKNDTNNLSQEAKMYDDIKKFCGSETAEAINLFIQLDDTDKGKIIGRMEIMLEDDKYQKGLEEKVI